MHPVNKRNFGAKAGKLAVKFNDGSSVKTGWIVAQVGARRYKVTNGSVVRIVHLAKTLAEVTAMATAPNNFCTIEITNFATGAVEHVTKMHHAICYTIEGSRLKWKLGHTAAAAGEGTMAVMVDIAPTVANAIPNETATVAAAWTYTVPANTFADLNGDTLTLAATVSPTAALPAWLTFDGHTFTKAAGAGVAGTTVVRVTASDGTLTAYDEFNLVLS